MITVDETIAQANAVLPHVPARDGELDLRWQAIIGVGEFVQSDPIPVWNFVKRWAAGADEDLQMALATCLLEHLLEHHFARLFPLIKSAAQVDASIARVVVKCWIVDDDAPLEDVAAFEQLKKECLANAI